MLCSSKNENEICNTVLSFSNVSILFLRRCDLLLSFVVSNKLFDHVVIDSVPGIFSTLSQLLEC